MVSSNRPAPRLETYSFLVSVYKYMLVSWHGNAFSTACPLWEECMYICVRWISITNTVVFSMLSTLKAVGKQLSCYSEALMGHCNGVNLYHQGPLLLTCLNLMSALISNYVIIKLWDEFTYLFPNFNGCTVEVWEWISNFIPHLIMM